MEYVRLSVPQPCSEDWEQMIPETGGQFCSVCSKHVVDFSTFSDEALIAYVQTNNNIHCGRYTRKQLSLNIPVPEPEEERHETFAAFPVKPMKNSTNIDRPKVQPFPMAITGWVKTRMGTAIQGAWIVQEETNTLVISDFDGHFSIPAAPGYSRLICIVAGQPLMEIKITDLGRPLFIYLR